MSKNIGAKRSKDISEEYLYHLLSGADGSSEEYEVYQKENRIFLKEEEKRTIARFCRFSRAIGHPSKKRQSEMQCYKKMIAVAAVLLMTFLMLDEDFRIRTYAFAKHSMESIKFTVQEAFGRAEMEPYLIQGVGNYAETEEVDLKLDWVLLDADELYFAIVSKVHLKEESEDAFYSVYPMVKEIRINGEKLQTSVMEGRSGIPAESMKEINKTLFQCKLSKRAAEENVNIQIVVDRICIGESTEDPKEEAKHRVIPKDIIFEVVGTTASLSKDTIESDLAIERSSDDISVWIRKLRINPVAQKIYATIDEPYDPEKKRFYKLEGKTGDGRFVAFEFRSNVLGEHREDDPKEGVFVLDENARLKNIYPEELCRQVQSMKLQAYYSIGWLVEEKSDNKNKEGIATYRIEGGDHFWKPIGEPFEIRWRLK